MATFTSFTEMELWQKARSYAIEVFQLTGFMGNLMSTSHRGYKFKYRA